MSDGVKLATGYIELTVKKAGDAMREITAEITGVGKHAEKVGQQAGEALDKGISKGATKAGKTIQDAITAGAAKAGEEAGRAAGDAIEQGVRKGATKAGETVREAISKGAKQAGEDVSNTKIEPKVDTKRARDAFKEFGKEVVVMVDKAANDAGITLEGVITGIAKEAGRKVGEELHDAIAKVPYLGDAARNIEGWISPAVEGFHGLNDAVAAFKEKDAAGALNGLADALNAVGQTQAGGTVKDIADKAAPLQEKISSLKDDIKGTTDGFLALAGNSGRIAGAFEAIGAAAGPVAAVLATLDTLMPGWHGAASGVLDQIQGKKGFNAKDWFNTLIPGTNIIDRTLGPVVNGPDPTNGVQSPIPAKPGVSAIPFPGSAPAVEPGYTAVPGSGDPFAALAPQSGGGAKAAPSGYAGDASLLANVPAGRYLQTQAADLTKGVADCSSAVEDLINMLDGVSTAGRQMATGNAPQWLAQHGFVPTNKPVAGAFNVGFNDHHMQATLPGGTPFNWGSDSAAANRGVGGTGAWDPAFTQHYYRPVGFDDGGVLPPGMQLINNASGQSEIVLTQDQAKNAMQGMPGMGAGPSDTPLSSGESPGPNGAAALASLGGGQSDSDPLAAVTNPGGGKDLRTQGYIPAGAGGSGTAGTSLWSGSLQLGAQAINGLIEQAGSAAATAVSAAATAGSFGAGGQAAGPAASFLIGIGTKMAERGVSYGFQMAGIAGDALTEILSPFGVPRLFQTDPSQFMPQLPGQAAAVTTGEKAQGQQAGLNTPSPSAPVQPGQMPGQQVLGPSAPIATAGTGDFKPAPVGTPGLSGPQPNGPAAPSLAPTQPVGPLAPQSGPMAQPQQPAVPMPQKPPGPLDFVPLDVGQFDTGGWLMPNGVAINMSNRPEPILNDEQWGNLHAIASQGMPAPDPKAFRGGDDYSVRIDQVTVKDVNELQREIDSRQRLNRMRYGGRP